MEIFDSYFELLEMIDNSIIKDSLNNSLLKIKSNQELVSDIKKYHDTHDKSLRDKIYNNIDFMEYKKLENRLNKLILSCNKKLGELKVENN